MNVARRPDLGAGSVFSGVIVVGSGSSGVGYQIEGDGLGIEAVHHGEQCWRNRDE